MKDKVIFRTEPNGNIIAIFPYIKENRDNVLIFSMNEGHTYGQYKAAMKNSKPTPPEEYKYLNRLLYNFYGYNTQPIKRIGRTK